MRRELSLPSARFVTTCLLITVAVLIGLSTLGQVSKYCFGHPEVKGFVPAFYVDYESNVPTWYSSLALALAGVLLGLITTAKCMDRDRFRYYWLAMSAIFFGLSMDEVAMFHELPIQPMRETFQTGGLLYYPWVLPAIVIILLLAVCFATFLRHLPSKTFRGFFLAAAVFFAGALGIEMISGLQADNFGEENWMYAAIVTAEEACEMLGVVVFIHTLLQYVHSYIGIRIWFGILPASTTESPPLRVDNPGSYNRLTVQEINSISELQPIRTEWNRLLARTQGATFFQSLNWLETYWKHFGEDQKLRVMVVYDGSEPIGITPFVVRSEPTRVGPVRFLTYPLSYWGSFYGPIGAHAELVLRESLDQIQHSTRDWDALELRWIGGVEGELQRTSKLVGELGCHVAPTIHGHTSLIDLSGSWEDYLESRSRKWRNNLARWKRNLAKHGEVRYERYRCQAEGDPRWDLYQHCLDIARRSWQGSSCDGTTLTHKSVAPFLHDLHEAAAVAGAIDMNLLFVDELPVAFAYGYHCASNLIGLRVGMLPEVSKTGAGNLLYANVIEDSYDRGDRRYDLGCGSLDAKRHLQTSVVPIYRVGHFPLSSLRCQLLRLKRMFDRRRDGIVDEHVASENRELKQANEVDPVSVLSSSAS